MSVRGERVVYRERSRDDNWEEPRRSYTTVKRYQVPERLYEEQPVEEDKIIIKRSERREDPPPAPRTEIDFRISERERDYPRSTHSYRHSDDWRVTERVTEREREPAQPRRDIAYRVIERDSDRDRDRFSGSRSDFRFAERETTNREIVRAPSPPSPERVREYRFERERDFSPPRREQRREERPPEVERYVKETEYYQQPQPIIIRESAAPQPIIIREERREPQQIVIRRDEPNYEIIEREEVRDERQSLVRREEPPPPATVVPSKAASTVAKSSVKQNDEDYFYERRIREVDRGPRRDERYREDDIRPRDSASQYGSDDSYEYVRRERVTEEGSRSRSHSPHHRRHLAEGALAGVAGAEILRSHRKREGRDPGKRGRSLVGGAAIGALGAEAYSRAKSWRRGSRSRSRSRSRSSSYEGRRRRRRSSRDHRSRSRSKSRVKQLGGLAAVAAVGALAGYALKNRGKNNETIIVNDPPPRRSRSRRRRASVDTGYLEEERLEDEAKAQNPEHRNRRIAQAGLASAAAAGIWERVRSKSRGAKGKSRSRSKSRIRQGVPIAAAGLGGAALAGLYEKNKANKAAKKEAIIEDELDRGRDRYSRSRSRSRSRSVPAPYPVQDGRRSDRRDMIAYGADPIYPDRGYYSDEEPGTYRRRQRGSSSGSSPDTRRRSRSRSKSRARNLAGAGLAAGAAGVAAHEWGKRGERKRQESEHRRRDDEYSEDYPPSEYDRPSGYITPPPQEHAGFNPPPQAYPGGHYFPPPPQQQAEPAYPAHAGPYSPQNNQQDYNPYPTYNPADYPPTAAQHPYEQTRGAYGESDATLGAPHPNDTFAGDPRYTAPEDAAAAREREHELREDARDARRGRDPGNVSGTASNTEYERSDASGDFQDQDADGLKTPRARSLSRVRFDLGSNVAFSPEDPRRHSTSGSQSDRDPPRSSDNEGHRRRRSRSGDRSDRDRRGGDSDDDTGRDDRRSRRRRRAKDPASQLFNDKYDRPPSGDHSDSEDTVELPPRFDEEGNKKPEGDDFAAKIQDMLAGKGMAGQLFKGLMGGAEDDGGRGSSSGRRRRRDR